MHHELNQSCLVAFKVRRPSLLDVCALKILQDSCYLDFDFQDGHRGLCFDSLWKQLAGDLPALPLIRCYTTIPGWQWFNPCQSDNPSVSVPRDWFGIWRLIPILGPHCCHGLKIESQCPLRKRFRSNQSIQLERASPVPFLQHLNIIVLAMCSKQYLRSGMSCCPCCVGLWMLTLGN